MSHQFDWEKRVPGLPDRPLKNGHRLEYVIACSQFLWALVKHGKLVDEKVNHFYHAPARQVTVVRLAEAAKMIVGEIQENNDLSAAKYELVLEHFQWCREQAPDIPAPCFALQEALQAHKTLLQGPLSMHYEALVLMTPSRIEASLRSL